MSSFVCEEWAGGEDGEEWTLEVETDRFAPWEPTTVSVSVRDVDGDSLAVLSPAEARDVACALISHALLAEMEDRRRAASTDNPKRCSA